MNKILGILGLLIFVCVLTSILNPDFVTPYNIQNTLRWTSYYGIISIGAALVIITGGIDLSIGSVIGLIGCLLALSLAILRDLPSGAALNGTLLITGGIGWLIAATWLHSAQLHAGVRQGAIGLICPPYALYRAARGPLAQRRAMAGYLVGLAVAVLGWLLPTVPIPPAWTTLLVLLWMLEISALLGLIHGFLITELRLQPFLVTLCGLLIYRGLARRVTNDQTQGFGQSHELLRSLANGRPCSMSLLILLLGCLLCAWALWRWSRRRSDLPAHPQTAPWCLAVIGAAALLAGGLHYVQDLDGLGGVPASWSQQALFWLGGTGLLAGLIGWQVSSRGEKRSWAVLAGAAAAMLLTGLTPLDRVGVPAPLLIMIAVALLAGGFVNQTVWGRYLLALGNNEQAARFSGIPTKAMTVTAYVLCALAAGLAGILFSLDINSIQPLSLGNAYELYAIAAAVLGGCSLRGGEGSILGVVIGAAVMRVLYNAINILGISTQLEYAVIGSVILGGVIVDELLRRWEQQRRRTSET